ncbi:MAG: protein kinase [Cyanobacteria bacterium HKST-UBA02]|nr:protein kinase [Cyanobacteria bacterium HKST-UBA02]
MSGSERLERAQLPDRYVIEQKLGEGGMGIVFKARDTMLDKTVAVKVMIHGADAASQARFQREAQMASRLNHPNIIQVLDFGITEEDCPFMVMEYVGGKTLAELIEERGRLSLSESMAVFLQIVQALSHAHGQGVLHRDLKPQNVLLTDGEDEDPRVKLVDFGLAKPVTDEGLSTLTREGAVVGSPLYMSPEQAKSDDLDERSDLYSFGCLMYEALTGAVPIKGATALETVSLKAVRKAPTLVDAGFDYGETLEKIVATCLAIDPEDRFASSDKLAEALSACQSGAAAETAESGDSSSSEESGLRPGKRFLPALITGLVLAGLSLLVLLYLSASKIPEPVSERAPESGTEPGTESGQFSLFDFGGHKIMEDREGIFRCQLAVNDADLEAFASSEEASKLETLVVQSDGVMGPGLASLKDLPIVRLEFEYPLKSPDEAMKYVSEIKGLTTLRLDGCFTLSSKGLKHLAKLPNLTYLSLENSGLIDDDSIPIINTFPKLKDLLIPRTNVRARGLSLLDRNRHYDQLSLTANKLTDRDLDSLAGLDISSPNLSINPDLTPAGVRKFMKGRKLVEITLKDLPWKQQDFIELSKDYPEVLIHTRETVQDGELLKSISRNYRSGIEQK